MIIDINNNCLNCLIEGKRDIIKRVFFTDHDVLYHDLFKVCIINSHINLLFSQSIFSSEVTGLFDLQFGNASIGSPFNNRLQDIHSTC